MKRKQNLKNLIVLGIIFGMTISILPTFLGKAAYSSNYTGYVRDRNGRAIVNAKVTLKINGVQYSYDYTDSNGYFSIGVYLPVNPTLEVTKTGWEKQTKTVSTMGGTYYFNLYSSSFALIVAGSTDNHFNRDAYVMYETLFQHYSFKESRMYLITSLSYIDGFSIPRDYAASQSNVEAACNEIADDVTQNDDVLVYWRSHGNMYEPFLSPYYVKLDCGSDEVTRSELDNALDVISCNRMLVMIGSCYSGYFIGGGMDNNNNRAILTSSRSTELSWTMPGYTYGYWNYGIIRALDPDENADDADDDNNGRVSVLELFEYAYDYVKSEDPFLINNNYYYQNPQIWIGSGFGSASGVYLGDQYY